MSEQPAFPPRFMVRQVGTQDPGNSVYVVLDIVHDMHARSALQGMARRYFLHGASAEADALRRLLAETEGAFIAVIQGRHQRMQELEKQFRRGKGK